MTLYSNLARETETVRIDALEAGALPIYWDAVGDYAAQVDAGRIKYRQACHLVARAVARVAKGRAA